MRGKWKAVLTAVVIIAVLAGCGRPSYEEQVSSLPTGEEEFAAAKEEILGSYRSSFDAFTADLADAEFFDWIKLTYGIEPVLQLKDALKNGSYTAETWHDVTGNTIRVLECFYKDVLDPSSPNYRPNVRMAGDSGNITIRLTGDFSLADNWHIIPEYDARGQGLEGVLSAETIETLRSADITLVNNEFTYSTRGTPLANKMYTFRADPSRVALFTELGVDIVSLANNHAYDYGADAFLDTLETLDNARIARIGGGKNIEEASEPFYYITGGRLIAFTAATKAEKYRLTPEATETTSGVLRTYDPEKYLKVIEEASAVSDYCIAYVHWGREDSHEIEEGLREMGAQFIDAGADIVIGAHAHLLQGIEFYSGKPIVFNLGNFLFNNETMDSGILELADDGKGNFSYRFIPCVQSGCYTQIVHGDEAQRVLDFMSSLSAGVKFEPDGLFYSAE